MLLSAAQPVKAQVHTVSSLLVLDMNRRLSARGCSLVSEVGASTSRNEPNFRRSPPPASPRMLRCCARQRERNLAQQVAPAQAPPNRCFKATPPYDLIDRRKRFVKIEPGVMCKDLYGKAAIRVQILTSYVCALARTATRCWTSS
jgi:hypothetical protein